MTHKPLYAGDGFAALMQSKMAFFTWELANDRVFGDEVLAEFFDLDHHDLAEGLPILPFVGRISEEDRPRVAESIHRGITTGSPYQENYSIQHRNGRVLTVVAVGRCFRSADGVPSIYSGTVIDVSCATALVKSSPLEMHCRAALELAKLKGNELAARYINSAISAICS